MLKKSYKVNIYLLKTYLLTAAVAAYTNSLPGQLDRFHKMADEKIFFANHKHHHHGYYQQLGEGSNRVKRVRTVFTQSQIERLEREFSKQHYMIGTERFCLARQLNLNESQVNRFFNVSATFCKTLYA